MAVTIVLGKPGVVSVAGTCLPSCMWGGLNGWGCLPGGSMFVGEVGDRGLSPGPWSLSPTSLCMYCLVST